MIPMVRKLLTAAAWISFVGAAGAQGPAADYPGSNVVRFVVPATPGGVQDLTTRLVANNLKERLGWNVIVENKPGASFAIAAQYVAKSPPDGLHILQGSRSLTILPQTQANLGYDLSKDFAPVIRYFGLPAVLTVHPSLPVQTLPELIEYSKKNKGALNYATPGSGTTTHLLVELLKTRTGMDMQDIPYRDNSSRIADILSGRVPVSINGISAAITDYIKTGKLRAVAVLGRQRISTLPDVPTTADLGIAAEMDFDPWFGFMVSSGTPAPIVQRLYREIKTTMADPKVQKAYMDQGAVFFDDDPLAFSKKIQEDLNLWKTMVPSLGIKPVN